MTRAYAPSIDDMTNRHRLIVIVIVLAALHGAIVFAGFLAPYDAASQNRSLPFVPPTRVHFFDSTGHFSPRPFVYGWIAREDVFGQYTEDRSESYPVHFLLPGDCYRLAGVMPSKMHLFGVNTPQHVFLFGTDGFGRDVFSRALYGGQISLLAGLLATAITLGVGSLMGALAGFYGGWLDDLLMRLADLFLALPWLYLLFAVRAFLPLRMEPSQAFFALVCVIGVVGWAKPARLVRGIFLSAKERNYVHAARGFGAGDAYIIRRHILPQASGVIFTQAVLLIPQYIMAEISLSFLGLGVGEPVPTWGNMMNALMQINALQSYWWMIAPGLIAMPFFLGYQILGRALDTSIIEA
jgi:peptide/nickel transport system permease protein